MQIIKKIGLVILSIISSLCFIAGVYTIIYFFTNFAYTFETYTANEMMGFLAALVFLTYLSLSVNRWCLKKVKGSEEKLFKNPFRHK